MNLKGRHMPFVVWVVACAVCLLTVGVALAESTWVDELANSLTFYKTSYPTANWDPYMEKVARIRDGLKRDDQQIVRIETDRFIKMLRTRAYGINDVAADELYNFAVTLMPADEQSSVSTLDLETVHERPMSVPDNVIQTPYQGGPPCKPGGCDYWLDDVFDAGAQ